MKIIANIIGVVAVALFMSSYQLKTQKRILIWNSIARVLFVIQYLMLFAYEGAVLDIVSIFSLIVAQKRDAPFIKKHFKLVFIATNLLLVISGLLFYRNIFSLLPLFGILLHTGALWLKNEKHIRIVSLIGSPFWLTYNILNCAYGSAVGDFLTISSIIIAIFRYDIKKKVAK